MSRKLKMLGLAFAAVFAMSAVAASAAQAKFDTVKVHGAETALLTGSAASVQVFTPEEGGTEVRCGEVAINPAVTVTSGATEITAHPVYNKEEKTCEIPGLGKAKVNTAGCNYLFTSETNAAGHAVVHIECEAGKEIHIVGPLGCTINIPGAQTLTGIHYTNNEPANTSEHDITLEATIGPKKSGSGIHFTSEGCLGLIPAEGNSATYSGNTTVKGYEDLGGTEGAQIGISSETMETAEMP